MIVEIDVYSGRANPHFQISAPEAASIRASLRNLPEQPELPGPGLGYRGFVLKSNDPNERITVCRGDVSVVDRKGETRHYRDRAGLERRLTVLAAQHGYGDLLRELGVEFAQHP